MEGYVGVVEVAKNRRGYGRVAGAFAEGVGARQGRNAELSPVVGRYDVAALQEVVDGQGGCRR